MYKHLKNKNIETERRTETKLKTIKGKQELDRNKLWEEIKRTLNTVVEEISTYERKTTI